MVPLTFGGTAWKCGPGNVEQSAPTYEGPTSRSARLAADPPVQSTSVAWWTHCPRHQTGCPTRPLRPPLHGLAPPLSTVLTAGRSRESPTTRGMGLPRGARARVVRPFHPTCSTPEERREENVTSKAPTDKRGRFPTSFELTAEKSRPGGDERRERRRGERSGRRAVSTTKHRRKQNRSEQAAGQS